MSSQPPPRRRRRRGLLAAVALGVLGAVLPAPAAQAAPPVPAYAVSLAPATVPAGTAATVILTITNAAQRGSVLPLKDAVVTLPGLQVESAQVVSGPARFAVVAIDADTVRLHAAGPPLLADSALAVEIALLPPAAGEYPLATEASGPAGKALHRIGPDPVLTVGTPTQTAATLQVTGQPTSTVTGTAVSPAVQVTARDGAGAPVVGVPVTLAYGANPGGAGPPSGDTATTGSDGVATFPDLTVPAPGIGYTLVATSGPVRSAPSEPFDVGDSVTACDPDTGCDSGTVEAPDGLSQMRVRADAAGSADELTVYFDDTRLSCQTQQEFTATFNVDNRSKTITYTAVEPADSLYAEHYGGHPEPTVCFASPEPFPAVGGTATRNEETGEFEGLLPRCAYYATSTSVTDPCVADSERVTYESGTTRTVFTVLAPPGDPRMST